MTDLIDDFDDFLNRANEEFDNDKRAKEANPKFERKKFTCESCGGTGVWRGGINRHGNGKCNACHGLGYFVTSPADRAKQRHNRSRRQQEHVAAAQADNEAGIGGAARIDALRAAGQWSSFAASLIDQHGRGKPWSEKQVACINNMLDKIDAKNEAKAKSDAKAPSVGSERIVKMFADALANGKKRRALLAGNFDEGGEMLNQIKMTPARDGERIWVKVDGEFCGGISATGELMLRREAPAWLPDRLAALAKNPDGECRLYGQRTGTCSCCGRELTNAESIDLGIGPICRQKWGL